MRLGFASSVLSLLFVEELCFADKQRRERLLRSNKELAQAEKENRLHRGVIDLTRLDKRRRMHARRAEQAMSTKTGLGNSEGMMSLRQITADASDVGILSTEPEGLNNEPQKHTERKQAASTARRTKFSRWYPPGRGNNSGYASFKRSRGHFYGSGKGKSSRFYSMMGMMSKSWGSKSRWHGNHRSMRKRSYHSYYRDRYYWNYDRPKHTVWSWHKDYDPSGKPMILQRPIQSPTSGTIPAPPNTPTKAPTNAPTNPPTNAPTKALTTGPTNTPTKSPTNVPTNPPTGPTNTPTSAPSEPAGETLQPTSAAIAACQFIPVEPDNPTFSVSYGCVNNTDAYWFSQLYIDLTQYGYAYCNCTTECPKRQGADSDRPFPICCAFQCINTTCGGYDETSTCFGYTIADF